LKPLMRQNSRQKKVIFSSVSENVLASLSDLYEKYAASSLWDKTMDLTLIWLISQLVRGLKATEGRKGVANR
jgi:hypothetical protein